MKFQVLSAGPLPAGSVQKAFAVAVGTVAGKANVNLDNGFKISRFIEFLRCEAFLLALKSVTLLT